MDAKTAWTKTRTFVTPRIYSGRNKRITVTVHYSMQGLCRLFLRATGALWYTFATIFYIWNVILFAFRGTLSCGIWAVLLALCLLERRMVRKP